MDVRGQNTSVVIPGSITQRTGLDSVLFPGEALVRGVPVARRGVLQGEAYTCCEPEPCTSAGAGNTAAGIPLPFLPRFSLVPALPLPWKDRAYLEGTGAPGEDLPCFPSHGSRSLGGVRIQLPAPRKGGMAQLSLGCRTKRCLWLSILPRVRWGRNRAFPPCNLQN